MSVALKGGQPVRSLPLPPRPPYGLGERNAANSVVASGQLSGFLAQAGEAFYGGPQVQALEQAFCERFGAKNAIAMNSGTSALFGSLRALNLTPTDQVIVTPWSMSASVGCVLEAGAVPVFADIELDTYGLAYQSVLRATTKQTKAIVIVNLFGCPARDHREIEAHAIQHGLALIEDSAQAIGAKSYVGWPGGHVEVFSLNRHKTLQCGEGGVATTNDPEIAEFLRGYRNHGEVLNYRQGTVGGNYRLGEIEAAIAQVQLERLEELTEPRITNADYLTTALADLGITPKVPEGVRHVYYLFATRWDVSAQKVSAALTAEGIPANTYVAPLYRLPCFQGYARNDDAAWEDLYPAVERAWREVVTIPHIHAEMTEKDLDDVIAAFRKVWQYRNEL